jgi:hypothetical protein
MAATLTDKSIGDLVTGTLDRLGRLRFNMIATRLQHYEVMSRMLRKDKLGFADGTGIQRRIMIDHSNQARMVGLHSTDSVNIGDVLTTLDIPWRHTEVPYGYERRELLENRGISRIVDILKVRRIDALVALAELLETQFWNKPTDSSDKLDVFGVPYWIVKNNGATAAFQGGNPSGFTSGAGNISSTTNSRWDNWAGGYTLVNKTDLIPKLRTAYRKVKFYSPVSLNDFRRGRGDQYRLYCNESTMQDFEDLGEGQNENLGRDLASMDNVMTFRKNPLIWVPKLDSDTTNPVYGINWSYFQIVFLLGDYLRETDPRLAPNQHNTWHVWIDLTWNVLCTDRRTNFVLSV